jgi:hypothetical protein
LFSARGIDPDLERVTERWPELPTHIKSAIIALVQSAPNGGDSE